jgi:BlaI family penicillinase repressor
MQLTRSEEHIMFILWKLEKAFIKDILEYYDDPRPAYTTVATVLKILEKKGYVGFKSYGKAFQYHPLISRSKYTINHLNPVLKKYFRNSLSEVISFYTDNNKVKVKEIDEAIKILNHLKKHRK